MGQLSFSGHESFQCRNLWLKKGYEYSMNGGSFNDDHAVVSMGVGKNMVGSIRFWLTAFGLIDNEGGVSNLAAYLFDDTSGVDPYLEDIGTLWLLHFLLVQNDRASIYGLFFNEFRKQKIEFSREQLKQFLIKYTEEKEEKHSENVIERDIGVMLKSYVKPTSSKSYKNMEDDYASLLVDLELIKQIPDRKDWYIAKSSPKASLPNKILLYSILQFKGDRDSVSLSKILNDPFSPGLIFTLDADSLVNMIKSIADEYSEVVYTDDAGIRELQIDSNLKAEKVLEDYYG
jgi:hypothetical protein